MSSDKYEAIFIAGSWEHMSSNKYHLIFITGSWEQMSSDKYHLIFIADSLKTDAQKMENRRTWANPQPANMVYLRYIITIADIYIIPNK